MKTMTKNITLFAAISGVLILAGCAHSNQLIVPDGAKRVNINQVHALPDTANDGLTQAQAEVEAMQTKITQLQSQLEQNKLEQSRLEQCNLAAKYEQIKVPALTESTLLGSTLFAFNQTVLLDAGKTALKSFAQSIKAMGNAKTIEIIGHADRLGSTAYNTALSTKRADVVRAYLQYENNLNNINFTVLGEGSLMPSGKTASCTNKLNHKSLIECLSPDRRVEIIVY